MGQDRTHPSLLVEQELVRGDCSPGRRVGNSAVKKGPRERLPAVLHTVR